MPKDSEIYKILVAGQAALEEAFHRNYMRLNANAILNDLDYVTLKESLRRLEDEYYFNNNSLQTRINIEEARP